MSHFPVTALRSVDLDVPDLDAAARFYVDVWALTLVTRDARTVVLRATGADHHVLVLHAATEPAIRSITFRVENPAVLDQIATRAQAHGGRVLQPPGPVDWPGAGTGTVILDPQSRILRFVHADTSRSPDPLARNRPERLSHVNVNSHDTDAARAFFEAVCGFELTDRSKLMAFVRCNTDHHVIVIADADVDGLNHVAFLMPDLEGVMLGAGRMVDHGFPIAWGVGRHGPGDNVFAYFIDPFGIVIEYTAELSQVDETYRVGGPADWTWPPGRTDQWGIAPPKTDALKHAQLAIRFATPAAA